MSDVSLEGTAKVLGRVHVIVFFPLRYPLGLAMI